MAAVVACNSKRERYDPIKWMISKPARRAPEPAKREPMSGEEVMAGFRKLGIPIVDKRAKRSD